MRIIRTRRGGRLMHGKHVVSEMLSAPGPTHSIFDVLAAAVSGFAKGPKTAMLGFAAGGMIAPLRGLGWTHPIRAVDLSLDALSLFDAYRGDWTGDVTVDEGDAVDWLRGGRRRWDVIIEDLSIQIPNDVTKPPVSLEVLPELIASKLRPNGIAVVNALLVEGLSRGAVLTTLSRAYPLARVINPSYSPKRQLQANSSRFGATKKRSATRPELRSSSCRRRAGGTAFSRWDKVERRRERVRFLASGRGVVEVA